MNRYSFRLIPSSSVFRYLIAGWCCLLASSVIFGQAALKKGDKLFQKMIYHEAAKAYKKAFDKEPSNAAAIGAAESYRKLADFSAAEAWFRRADWKSETNPRYRFDFAQALKSNGHYDEAKVQFVKWGVQIKNPKKGEFWANTCNLAAEMKKDEQGYQVRPLTVSSGNSEISPVLYRKGIVFASNRPRAETIGRRDGRNAKPFYDLWYAERAPNGVFEKPVIMKGKINTGLNDGPVTFSQAGHIAYITRTNTKGLNKRSKEKKIRKLQLFSTRKINEKWRDVQPFPFNNREYTFAHASLSPDEKTLYFTTDMPGGFGGTDIWFVKKEGESWSKPKNLGPKLNTQGNEAFPFVMKDGLLYFASDGHAGVGGFDLFSARVNKGTASQIENLGVPINSPADDFGLIWEAGAPTGYFTSNRVGGQGQDDLYFFTRSQAMEVIVAEKGSNFAIPNAQVEVQDYNGKSFTYTTDKEGKFRHYIKEGREYRVIVAHEDYKGGTFRISTKDINPARDLNKRLTLEKESRYTVSGFVVDSLTQKPMPGVVVRLVEIGESQLKTNKLGRFVKEIEPNKDYTMFISQEGYVPKSFDFTTKGLTKPTALNYNIGLLPGDSWLYVEGVIRDQETKEPLKGVNIRVIEDYSQQKVAHVQTNSSGGFFITLAPNRTYSIIASTYGHFANRYDHEVFEGKLRDSIVVNLNLYDRAVGKIVNTLYYDFNASLLRSFDKRELNECAYFLVDNPDVSVDLGAHTDIRGSAAYNKKLSFRRAQSAVDYILTRQIEEQRIIANGYGEEFPAVDCVGGEMNCTEEQHQKNRRAELKVIQIEE